MKVLLGMSGGVDSAFSAIKLRQMGYEVEGCVLVMHEHTETEEAKKCAEQLGIRLHEVDATESFDNIIKTNFADEYARGRTPNPCILCNERVKFRALLNHALSCGFDAIATGHYAKIVDVCDEYGVRRAIGRADDEKKDQSYMLYRLGQDVLQRLILPLSDMTKDRVRALSLEYGLAAAERKDSQEICFLPEGNYAEFVESVKGEFLPGNFVDLGGKVLGKHKGIIRYTVGQRKGLGISLGERAFVTKIDPESNEITLSDRVDGVCELVISEVVYSGMTPDMIDGEEPLFAKVRYTAPLSRVLAFRESEGRIRLKFDAPIKAAPGQSCVVYKEGTVAFGGIIE